jgi:hypothetical protein
MVARLFCLASIFFLVGDGCTYDCTGTLFDLEINDIVVDGLGDMTKEECGEVYAEIEPQTPAFAKIFCVEHSVSRQDL